MRDSPRPRNRGASSPSRPSACSLRTRAARPRETKTQTPGGERDNSGERHRPSNGGARRDDDLVCARMATRRRAPRFPFERRTAARPPRRTSRNEPTWAPSNVSRVVPRKVAIAPAPANEHEQRGGARSRSCVWRDESTTSAADKKRRQLENTGWRHEGGSVGVSQTQNLGRPWRRSCARSRLACRRPPR